MEVDLMLADHLHEGVKIRKEDVLINFVEVPKENWSFGNGEAQYVTPPKWIEDDTSCGKWWGKSSILEATGRLQSHRGHPGGFTMQMLIVGIGALGGTIAARAICAGLPVRLAARNTDSAEALRRSGLRVSGIGGEVRADVIDIAAVEDYGKGDQFDLILLATKAQDTLEVAPRLLRLLAPGGVMLPIQNGGVARVLADGLG
jgi:hypothetical protein